LSFRNNAQQDSLQLLVWLALAVAQQAEEFISRPDAFMAKARQHVAQHANPSASKQAAMVMGREAASTTLAAAAADAVKSHPADAALAQVQQDVAEASLRSGKGYSSTASNCNSPTVRAAAPGRSL